MFRNIGLPEILLLVLLFIVVFGSKRIPDIAESIGKALKKFRKASQETENDSDSQKSEKEDDESK
ncbi:MAG: twin-arginine translocase TatA/TatE family subunit [Fibrobacter sp.]|jgi:sec-independent protein translocase protein TatA|nr:twin-arginine translocase TatA/TatE family subunit [Fibrobacter sp.]